MQPPSPAVDQPRLAALDVQYFDSYAQAACVVASDWTAQAPDGEWTAIHESPSDYEPGSFFKRELPPLLKVLSQLPVLPRLLIVDGYVWLDEGRPGLGYHLHQALAEQSLVVGVAKTAFAGNWAAVEIRRHGTRPLYVTSIGMPVEEAASHVLQMAGSFRIPDLLRRTDQLAKTVQK